MSVTISRLSRYSVSGCSPAIGVASASPRSLIDSTSNVRGREAWVISGRLILRTLLAPDVGHFDLAQRGGFSGADLRIPVRAHAPDRTNRRGKCIVGRARAQQRAQVVAVGREQARVEHTIRGQTHARAFAAEGLRH